MSKKSLKLRTVNKSTPLYHLNRFLTDFRFSLEKEIVYLLVTKGKANSEGSEWEEIFTTRIGADWKLSSVGLDDVVLGNTARGAKTVKATNPDAIQKARLISVRNSYVYSFGREKSASEHRSYGNHIGINSQS